MADRPTVHASAVLVGARAILIRGPSGAGKSRLALALIDAARARLVPFARLVADDRVELDASHGRLLARAPNSLAGLIEVRGLGIRRIPYEPIAVVGTIVDLAAADPQRSPLPPGQSGESAVVAGIRLPRLAAAAGADPLPAVLALFNTADPGVDDKNNARRWGD